MPRPSHSSWYYHSQNIGWAVQIIQFLILYFPSLPCYLMPLRPKYSPQHPISKHPQPTFVPQCQRPSFTPVQDSPYYSFVKFSTYFWVGCLE
jgi:hypothetical protein